MSKNEAGDILNSGEICYNKRCKQEGKVVSDMKEKLKYTSDVTAEEIKILTKYDEHKATIDAITGQDNLDFPFSKAEVSEYVIKMVLPDGNYLFLPVIASDGQGYRSDKKKGYSTIHRPETKAETREQKRAEKAKAKAEEEKAEKAKKDEEKK